LFACGFFPLLFSDPISGRVKMNDFLFCKKLNALLFLDSVEEGDGYQ
jgi:hypothetical protein